MRVKQTARKSTASIEQHASFPQETRRSSRPSAAATAAADTPLGPQRSSRTRVLNDPLSVRLNNLLQTKRKSATPSQRDSFTSQAGNTSGMGAACKKIYADQVKTKPRSKNGELALKEIRLLQKSYSLLIPRAAFHRIVREVTQNVVSYSGLASDGAAQIRYQTSALEALQEAAEAYLVQMFEDSYLCCLHAKRVTLFVQDMQLCRRLQIQRPLI